jgi:ABC-type phosphate transport system substrate-binding protein
MKRGNAACLFALTAIFAGWSASREVPVQAQATDVLVMVVNNANTAVNNMSIGEARKLLLGETSDWRTGSKVLVVLKPVGNPDRATVLKKICGMTETIYTRYEMQASFTGQTVATVNVASSDAAVKATVKANAGAIGFLHKSEVDASVKSVLTLD